MNAQAELPIVGAVSPQLAQEKNIALCKTIGSAIERAQVSAGMTQEALADRMGVSTGYLSLLIAGKRNVAVVHVLRAVRATGSLAPIQWVCKQVGGELYADPVEQKKARLRAELADLERT